MATWEDSILVSDFKVFALHLRKWRGWGYHSNLAVIPGIKSPVAKVQLCHLLVRKHGLLMSPLFTVVFLSVV